MTTDINQLIDLAKSGEMFILVDGDDDDSHGDLCVLSEFATPEAINFMSKHARGLICLAIDRQRAETLGLDYPEVSYDAPRQSAITVSIEALEGVTNGISAQDRALSIAVAANPKYGASDITSPGHLFPLIARDGGTLVRAGRTEAIVDIAYAARSWPSGVLCEMMKEDGALADFPWLKKFAKKHNLAIGTITDLIGLRRQSQTIVKRGGEMILRSSIGGAWRMMIYINTASYAEHVALVKGDISSDEPVLVRMHALNIMSDVLGEDIEGRTGTEIQSAMRMIANEGRGVVVMLREPSPTTLSDLVQRKISGDSQSRPEIRNYGVGAQILIDLGIEDMVLLSNVQRNIVGLDGYGLTVTAYRPFSRPGSDDDK